MMRIKYNTYQGNVPNLVKGGTIPNLMHDGRYQDASIQHIHPSGAVVLSFADGSTCVATIHIEERR